MVFLQGRFKPDGSFDWRCALIDAAIIAGLNFFTALAGLGVTGLFADPPKALIACAISSAIGFFATLAFKRGLTNKPPTPTP
jgi:hypothetical protein